MTYDAWKTREPDVYSDKEYRSQCDCCGKMKYGCVDLWVSYVGDAHACPECRGEEPGAYGEYEHEDKLEREARRWEKLFDDIAGPR